MPAVFEERLLSSLEVSRSAGTDTAISVVIASATIVGKIAKPMKQEVVVLGKRTFEYWSTQGKSLFLPSSPA